MTPRFEFRVFGDHLDAAHDRLQRVAAVVGDRESRTDTYFVVPERADASLKLRGGKLDLKVLREQPDGLELWEPAAEAEFPVAPEILRDELLGPAGIRIELPDEAVDRERLLALAWAAPRTRTATLEKRRRRYRIGDVSAEFTRLSLDGQALESIAVEEADREQALRAVVALGLSNRRNRSYQRFLVERLFGATGPGGGDP